MLSVENLTKRFNGLEAVSGLSFSLEPGWICGFVGPNGAGKTTTMRMIATLEEPDCGRICVQGADIFSNPYKVRRALGFMPDHYGIYPNLTCEDYLEFYARAYEVDPKIRTRRVAAIMGFTGLDKLREKKVETLSKGMKQRLSLSRALINDPELLVLDEPTAGLDPHARIEFRYMLKDLAQRGKTVLLSSHILADLGEICDQLLIIDQGKRVAFNSFEDLQNTMSPETRYTVKLLGSNKVESLERFLLERAFIKGVQPGVNTSLSFSYSGQPEDIPALLSDILSAGFSVTEFRKEDMSVESVFLKITQANG